MLGSFLGSPERQLQEKKHIAILVPKLQIKVQNMALATHTKSDNNGEIMESCPGYQRNMLDSFTVLFIITLVHRFT